MMKTFLLAAALSLGAMAATPASAQIIGQVTLMAFNYCPQGWHGADGTMLPIAQYPALFSLLGPKYGGDGVTTFALPKLSGPISASGAPLLYCIAMEGSFPPHATASAITADKAKALKTDKTHP